MPITAVRSTNIKVGFDVDNDGVADPGDILQHSLIITNTEAIALNGLTIQETLAGITTVPGSVMIGPIALDDTFNMVGNTSITITKAQLIGNDVDPDGAEANMTVVIDLASDLNGTIIDNGDNTYTFTPNVGFEGNASFEYSLVDEQGVTSVPVGTIDGLVSIAVEDMVWFIDNTAPGSTNVGTQANPFTSIASFNTANTGVGSNPAAGDIIYLREGTYTEADGINLLNNQKLVGQGENLVVNNSVLGDVTVETGAVGQTPVIVVTGAANQGIQLGSGNTISGLDVGMSNATAVGIADGGATVGNLVISNVAVGTATANTGAAIDIDQGGTLNVLLESIRSTGASQAIDLGSTTGLSGTGNHFTVSGTTIIDDATADGIAISNSTVVNPLNATFTGKVTILNDAGGANGDGVDLQNNNAGTYSLNGGVDIVVNGINAFGFRAQSSGTVNVVDVGTTQIVSNNGTAILINPTTLNATLDTVTSGDGGTGAGISLTGMSGSLTIGTVNISGQATNGIAVASSSGSLTVNGGSIGTGDASNDAVNVSGGTGAITINASITKTTDGNVADISSHATGGISFGGAINATGNGTGITLVNNSSGAISFTNAAVNLNTGTTTAVNFTNNQATGATVTFSAGNLNIDTTSGTGINAINTTNPNVDTLTIGGVGDGAGTAGDNVVDVTAGGRAIIINGVTTNAQFEHVSNAGGSGTAIFVRNNGATGSFEITGEGTTDASGGTIALTAGGADGATDAGIGIYLENANNISLTNLDFNGTFNNFGIRGLNVNNFTLRDSEMDALVARFGTLSASGTPEGALIFGTPGSGTGLRGTGIIEGNVIGSSSFDNLDVYNYGANTLNLTIRDSATTQAVFNDMLSGGNDGMLIETGGSHNLTLLVGGDQVAGGPNEGVQFTGVYGDHIQTNAVGTTVQNINITHNSFTQSVPDGPFVAGGGVRIGGGSGAAGTNITVNYNFSNNTLKGAFDSALDARFNGLAGTITGIIANNFIGTDNGVYEATVANRGAGAAPGEVGMFLGIERVGSVSNGNMTYAMRIQNNNIADTSGESVYIISQNSNGQGPPSVVEVTMLNNVFSEINPVTFSGLRFLAGGGSVGDDGRMGTVVSGNTIDVTGLVAAPGIFYDQAGIVATSPTHFYVPGIGGPFSGAAADSNLDSFLDGVDGAGPDTQNTFVGTTDETESFGVEGLTGEGLTLPVPIMAAPAAGEDWATAFHNWLANLQPPAPPPLVDNGSGGSGDGGGGSGGGGDPGAGDPPPPPEPPHPVIVDDGVLSQAELDYFVDAAIQHWTAAGATAAQIAEMRATAVSVADMTGSYLGTSDAVSVRIDRNGAGYGWFLDHTPGDNAEYQGSGTRLTADSGPAAGKMDLLTVLMHEFGHQVGLDDLYGAGDTDELMYGYANLGERRLPQGDDLADAAPGSMLHESFLLAPVAVGTLPAGKAVRILWESTVDTFSNQLIPNPFGFFSTISGDNFVAFNSNTENLTIDSLSLSGTIWNDNGAGGGVAANGIKDGTEAGVSGVTVSLFVDANNDNAADTPGTPLVTGVLTNGSGDYTFSNLAEGNYIVRVDQDNFDASGNVSLFTPGLLNSPVTSPEPFDPDNNANNDDNGARVLGQAAWSNAITLNYNSETVPDGPGHLDINDTLDFGFFANSAPVLADLAGDTSTFTEGGTPVILDDSSAPELAASVTDANQPQLNGGTLTVAITVNEDAADDVLGISTAGTVTLSSGTSVGSIVSVGGLAIGTVTADGNGGDDLVVSLNTDDATLANVTTLIRSLTYANIDTGNPSALQRTVAVTLDDGLGGSDSENVLVNVTAVNDPPTGADNTITIDEDDFGDIDAADFGFNDVDGDSLSAVTITGVTGGTLYYDSGNDGFDPGDAVSTFPITVTAADLAGNLVAFRAGPNVNGTGIGTITFQVVDDSGAGNDTDTSANTLTVDVAPINDQPDVPATLADVNATEGALAAVSGITVSDVDLDALNAGSGDYDGAIFGIGQAVPDASDSFAIDTTGASFTISGNQLRAGGLEFATFTVGGGGLGIAFNSNGTIATTALVNEVLSRIQYVTNADDPPATLTLTYFLIDGAPGAGQGTVVGGNDLDAGTVDVNITAVNDEPTLTATALDPTFTEGDAARDLFSTVAASTVEAGQTMTSMTVTVSNVTDSANEVMVFDGSDVALTNGNSVVTATNTLTVNVSVTGTTATLTFTGASLTSVETTTLIDGLAYRNDSEDPTDADRVVTITSLSDDGSNTTPNDNTSALSVASTVDVEPVDDDSIAGDDTNSVLENGTIIGASVFGNDSDPDDPLLVVEVNGVAADVGTQITLASGALLTLNDDGSYDYDPNGAFDYLITVAKATATGAVNTTFADTFTYELEDGTGPATVTITVNGVESAGDELWGNGAGNSINDQFDDDVFRLGQGGDDTVNGFGGNDIFSFGSAFTDLDIVDGGTGFDTIVLAGDYFTTPLVLSPTGVTSVERILVLSDPLLAGFSYDITTDDTNVAAGEVLIVDASGLSSIEELLFDGSAETDGRFLLVGGGCDDELIGGAGDDVLIGGADFNFLDGNGGIDRVDYSLVAGPVDVDLGAGGASDNGLGGADLLEDIENVTGSAFADILVGDGLANVLDGGLGTDQMTGGDGDDTYVVDNVGDTVSETSALGGIDTVKSSIGYTLGANLETLFLTGTGTINGTGNALDNNLTGNSAANTLNGGIGADRMKGDGGNDTYIVDNAGDVVIENFLTEGVDTVKSSVSFTLNYFVDNLVLTGAAAINGTGNGLVNILTGNNAANVLNGGTGADQMKGDGGDDIYVVDNAGDVVIENSAADGTDTVRSSVTFSLAGQQLEHLVLTGTSAINGTGNGLVNNLTGNNAANILNGAAGADQMKGDAGNDTYVVDNVGDVVIENALADGIDTVQSNISYTLGSFVENLTLTGAAAINGTGNGLGNVITGNSAANLIKGMAGADTLSGAGGADTLEGGIGDDALFGGVGHDDLSGGVGQDGFRFDTALSAANNVDDILDFSVADDTIFLDRDIFTGIAADGPLAAGAFRAGTTALDGDDRILYDAATGLIRYDADGIGGTAAILFATVTPGTVLTSADFFGYT